MAGDLPAAEDRSPRPDREPAPRAAWGARVELTVAAALTVTLLAVAPLRLYAAIFVAGVEACVVAPALILMDPPTLLDASIALVRSTLLVLPLFVAFARAERRRLAWAPLVVPAILIALAVAPHGLRGGGPMVALVVISVGATAAQARWWLRWTAALPLLFALHPTVTTHQRASMALPGAHARLVARCRENDGERPVGVDPLLFSPHHYALTPFDEGRLLLTGEGGSTWVVRDADGRVRIAERSEVSGNYWGGTRGDGRLFVAHRDDVRAVRWREGREEVETFSLLEVREPWEVDALDAVYDAPTRSVFVGELASGSLIRVPLDGARPTLHPLGLFYLQLAPGPSGSLVGISTTELAVIDPARGAIRARQPAALCAGGVASCAADHAVAIADYAGRVRLFEVGADGRYAFARGAALPSPRRVAFSPDCRAIAVTSANDETLVVLARDDLRELARYRLGPGLRDVHWSDDNDLYAVDACTVTRLRPWLP